MTTLRVVHRSLASISDVGDAIPYVLDLSASEDAGAVAAVLSGGACKVVDARTLSQRGALFAASDRAGARAAAWIPNSSAWTPCSIEWMPSA